MSKTPKQIHKHVLGVRCVSRANGTMHIDVNWRDKVLCYGFTDRMAVAGWIEHVLNSHWKGIPPEPSE